MITFEISIPDDNYRELLRCLKRLRLTYDCNCITRDIFCSSAIRFFIEHENKKMDEYIEGVLENGTKF